MKICLEFADLSCRHCAHAVQFLCKSLPGVIDIHFENDFRRAHLEVHPEMNRDWLYKAVEEAGYHVLNIEDVEEC